MDIGYGNLLGILIGMHIAWVCAYLAFFYGKKSWSLAREMWAVGVVAGMTITTIAASGLIQDPVKYIFTVTSGIMPTHAASVTLLISIFVFMVFFIHPILIMWAIKSMIRGLDKPGKY